MNTLSRLLLFTAMIAIVFSSTVGYVTYSSNEMKDNDCLVRIAEDFCESKGMEYNSDMETFPGIIYNFYCNEDSRSTGVGDSYKFTDSEVERCLG